jgi:predicted RNA-binding Zn-ribbon protein involved in translation (DUF1610 family)
MYLDISLPIVLKIPLLQKSIQAKAALGKLHMTHAHHENAAQHSCSSCTILMLKLHKTHAQAAQYSCSNCTKLMLKLHNTHAQAAQYSCSSCTILILKLHNTHVQNGLNSCSSCTILMLKLHNSNVQASSMPQYYVYRFTRIFAMSNFM